MPKTNKTIEEILIENIEQYFTRIKKLKEHCSRNDFLERRENSSLVRLLGLKKIDHWNFIEKKVKKFLLDENYETALSMVNIALTHLKIKTMWILSDETVAFSNAAILSDIGSKTPVIGTFFTGFYRNFHREGVDKTKTRLEQINSWLIELEEYFTPTLLNRLKRICR